MLNKKIDPAVYLQTYVYIPRAGQSSAPTGCLLRSSGSRHCGTAAVLPRTQTCARLHARLPARYSVLLDHVAQEMEPTTFLKMLPVNGSMDFYLPYIQQSYKAGCLSMLSKHVEAAAVELDGGF